MVGGRFQLNYANAPAELLGLRHYGRVPDGRRPQRYCIIGHRAGVCRRQASRFTFYPGSRAAAAAAASSRSAHAGSEGNKNCYEPMTQHTGHDTAQISP